MSTTTSKGTGNTTEAGGKVAKVVVEQVNVNIECNYKPVDLVCLFDDGRVMRVGNGDKALACARVVERAVNNYDSQSAELAALKASNAALVEAVERIERELRRIAVNSTRPPVYMIREMHEWARAALASVKS